MKKIFLLTFSSIAGGVPLLSYSQAPVPNFTVSDLTPCENTCVDFTDLSTNSPTSWQ